ncbi:MAG: glycosyltransferase family 2 protein [Lentisphaeraceae bacterium]|nr:glycosyltransferase family 2 protein [Lentisphaeraceae bacterium]
MHKLKFCLIVPCYNHESLLNRMLLQLEPYKLDCLVIDDGSNETAQKTIEECTSKKPWVTLIKRVKNGGKGEAVKDGFQLAISKGYTHALQIDADCQHDVNDIPKFIQLSEANPDSIITGEAKYDKSVPKSRLYGRYINHFWVMVETLSFKVLDTMCGFRIYPLAQLSKVKMSSIGSRMDFDVEMAVRSIWAGIPLKTIDTKVIYPEDGISNFHYLKGNLRITWMHIKLCCGMILRLPKLLYRKFSS